MELRFDPLIKKERDNAKHIIECAEKLEEIISKSDFGKQAVLVGDASVLSLKEASERIKELGG